MVNFGTYFRDGGSFNSHVDWSSCGGIFLVLMKCYVILCKCGGIENSSHVFMEYCLSRIYQVFKGHLDSHSYQAPSLTTNPIHSFELYFLYQSHYQYFHPLHG